jgi:hypothetical protein
VIDRRGSRLFCGGDDLFSWASVCGGTGFGLFPELRVTHLINAQRLTRGYMLRLLHDHRLSHGVLGYMLDGTRPRRIDLIRCVDVFLRGIKNGWFPMRCQWATARGEDRAARLIAEQGLRRVTVLDVVPSGPDPVPLETVSTAITAGVFLLVRELAASI